MPRLNMNSRKVNSMRTIAALAVILTIAALLVGCRDDATPTPVPTPSPIPTETPTKEPSTATPPPTVAPPMTLAPTAAPPATPDSEAEADPSDAYFALERVLDISIQIDPEDWDTLRHQTRTFDDLMAEIEEYGLSRPFANIYDWFSGTVTVDGETYADVGVRKKGFLGSQSDTKPALKLRFDKYVDGQALGGVMERMTLNNSIQDPSMVNTCLSYRIFAATGSPAPRCNFAAVSVNGKDLGLYVHVEEIKPPFLARHFDSAEGNLYEGTVSDFTPVYRGTFEKKTNEDADDWSDIDAVVAALQEPSDAGLKALTEIVDLDRFLSFWATEVLVGHWDGYAGDRNNYQFYREPDGPFVFIPWGVDDTFHLEDDPNPFDDISDPPPSVLALTAIPNRLYNNPDWRVKYATRLKEILDAVWDEDELLAFVDEIADIVQQHALPEDRTAAARDTERVRKFILKRKGEILADLTPEPPDWPEPEGPVSAEDSVWAAAAFGDIAALEGHIAAGASLDAYDPIFGVTPLSWAALHGHTEAAAWLLETGADIGALNQDGGTALHAAAFMGRAEIVRLLLEHGADANAVDANGVRPLDSSRADAETTEWIAGLLGIRYSEVALAEGRREVAVLLGAGEGELNGGLLPGALEAAFETTWGSNLSANPLGEGQVISLLLDGAEESVDGFGVIAGLSSPEEKLLLPDVAQTASIAVLEVEPDGSISGMTLVLALEQLTSGATLVIGEDAVAGGIWSIPPGRAAPDFFAPFTGGVLELTEADTAPGADIAGSFHGSFRGNGMAALDIGLVINEVAAKGDPLDWFELYNASSDPIALFGFVLADDLTDADKRVAFPDGTVIEPGQYLQFQLDKDGWPGFALGSDEELGIWLLDGTLVATVDWDEGQSGEGQSYARIPNVVGEFQTVGGPTPGASNQP